VQGGKQQPGSVDAGRAAAGPTPGVRRASGHGARIRFFGRMRATVTPGTHQMLAGAYRLAGSPSGRHNTSDAGDHPRRHGDRCPDAGTTGTAAA
jgi:hypothetical protein